MTDEVLAAIANISERLSRIEHSLAEVRSLVGPFGTVFPDGSLLVQTIHGNKYFIDASDEIMAPQLVIYRQWEADLSAYVINSATSDCVFVDVGANFGYFTCMAASRIGSSGAGRVIAVEPNPKMFRLLEKNVSINWSMSKVFLHHCAVSDAGGFVEFMVPQSRAANASLVPAGGVDNNLERMIVRSAALDDLTGNLAVDILKIDVEGFEAMVIRGGTKTIERSTNINIVMEWSLDQMKAAGFSSEDVTTIFDQLGLTAHRLPSSRFAEGVEWEKNALSSADLGGIGYDNIVLRRRQ